MYYCTPKLLPSSKPAMAHQVFSCSVTVIVTLLLTSFAFKDLCDFTGSTQTVQENFAVLTNYPSFIYIFLSPLVWPSLEEKGNILPTTVNNITRGKLGILLLTK
jgi:hypothetical protein